MATLLILIQKKWKIKYFYVNQNPAKGGISASSQGKEWNY